MEGDIVLPNTGRTEVIFDIFVADPLVIDQYVYRCWLQGLEGMMIYLKIQNRFLYLQLYFCAYIMPNTHVITQKRKLPLENLISFQYKCKYSSRTYHNFYYLKFMTNLETLSFWYAFIYLIFHN